MNVEAVAKKYNLRLLVQFGSSIRGKMHKESDIDIAYLGARALSVEEEGKLILDLAESLKIPVEKIDLSSLHRARNPLFLVEIFRDGKLLYGEDATIFDKYKIYSVHIYFETEKYRRLTSRFVKNQVEAYRKELRI